MAATRFPNAFAFGRYNNFKAGTDSLISSAETAPDVRISSFVQIDNASATDISNFNNGEEGQVIVVNMLDDLSTVLDGTYVSLEEGQPIHGDGNNVTLIKNKGVWNEIARSVNNYETSVAAGGGSTLTVDTATKVLILTGGSGGKPFTYSTVNGGTLYQEVLLVQNSGGIEINIMNTVGNIMIAGTNAFTLDDVIGGVKLVRTQSSYWTLMI